MTAVTRRFRLSLNLVSSTQVFFAPRQDREAGLHLIRVSREGWRADFAPHIRIPPGSDEVGLFLAVDGAGTALRGDVAQRLETGRLFVIDSGGEWRVRSERDRPLDFLVVFAGGSEAVTLLADAVPDASKVLAPDNAHAVRRAFQHCFEAAVEGGPEAEAIGLDLFRALLRTIRNRRPAADTAVDPGRDACYRCKAMIDTRFRELRRVEAVAQAAGISRAHLDALFRTYLATTPKDYLLDTKMHYAAHLLRLGDVPIRAIAAELGYADQYTFSRAFKRRLGRAPSRY